jgi:hypothetical protein
MCATPIGTTIECATKVRLRRWFVNWFKSATRKFPFIVLRSPVANRGGQFRCGDHGERWHVKRERLR